MEINYCQQFEKIRNVTEMPSKLAVEGLPFCDYIPKPFTSLSRSKCGLIAASRLDGSIDIYDEKDCYYLIHHIPPSVLTSVYSLCWINRRLFATGGEGRIFELDLFSVQPKVHYLLKILYFPSQAFYCLVACLQDVSLHMKNL